MLFRSQNLPNGALCGIWKIEESIELLRANLSSDTLSDVRFANIKNKVRQQEWLAVRCLLKELCKEEKQVLYTATGRPYVSDSSFHLSISHTKGYASVLLHPTCEVGIDIEQRSERAMKLKERFLNSSEISFLGEAEEAIQSTICWSAKETLFKIMDAEEVDFIRHLHINPFTVSDSGSFTAIETRTPKNQKYIVQYHLFPDFVLTWCSC